MSEVVFYGDLNCPFCFAEHERILELGYADKIPFRAVQHWPELTVPWNEHDDHVQRLLDEVMPQLDELASEVEIRRPPACPNTKHATMALAEATLVDPRRAIVFRTWMFRALWRDGRDISDDAVIDEGWRAAELGERPSPPSRAARRMARVWTTEWELAPFDQRVPVLATGSGDRLLGLADPEQIERFLRDSTTGSHLPGVCRPRR